MNKTVLVTGGSRGIGREIAITLAKEGNKVVLTYKKEKKLAEETVNEIKKIGGKAITMQLFIEDRNAVRDTINMIKKYFNPHIDVLVNNASIAQEKPFETITDDDWDNMLKINLRGPFILCQEIIPDMIAQKWGRIINISSIGGQWGGFNQVHYAAAKAGLINLTKSLARIYSGKGITTNAISPGLVGTEMSSKELNSEAGKIKIGNIPMGRIATANEIAEIVSFLASDKASYITGQTINANGGMYFG